MRRVAAEYILMVHRKGELTFTAVDRGWPYQVALEEQKCSLKNFEVLQAFNYGLSLCARGHSVSYDGKWYRVFCYSHKPDAESFLARFGGEWFDPREKGRGSNWMRWSKGKFDGRIEEFWQNPQRRIQLPRG